jgi:hypothetical protein
MQDSGDRRLKVKELPLYSTDYGRKSVFVNLVHDKTDFERGITQVRQVAFDFVDKFSETKERVIRFYETGVAHTQSTLDYVRSETNILPKLTFITLSGLGGLLVGFRRSKFRKFLYSASFGTGALALCYPNETRIYSKNAYDWTLNKTKSLYEQYTTKEESNRTSQVPKIETPKIVNTNPKDQVFNYTPANETASKEAIIEGDKGQASDEDSDMYTTRG